MVELGFGAAGSVDASVSDLAQGLVGSEILKIAAEIRTMVRAGKPVCNPPYAPLSPEARKNDVPSIAISCSDACRLSL